MSNIDDSTGGKSRVVRAVQARPPTTMPDFYLQWGRENVKEYAKNANTALGQLLTLSTALLGGTIAFWDRIPIDVLYRRFVIAALLVTVFICLYSAMPSEGSMDLADPEDIRRHMEELRDTKMRRLVWAKISLMTTLVLAVFGLLIAGTDFDIWLKDVIRILEPRSL